MPKPFLPLDLAELREALRRFRFTREIDAVHMHHTWIPRRSQFRGEGTIEAMYRDHVTNRGFSDIAQHVTIAPDGTIWTGRSWNQPPASARGYNGNSSHGPFMFEIIGNFDRGEEILEGRQRDVVLEVIAAVQTRFRLPPESLRFHNQMSGKSCPGSSIDYRQFLEEVRRRHADLEGAGRSSPRERSEGPFSAEHAERPEDSRDLEEGRLQARLAYALDVLARPAARGGEELDGELDETGMSAERQDLLSGAGDYTDVPPAGRARGGASRRDKLSAEEKARLRPHVINLREGRLIEGGDFFSLPGDVEAIFGEHLENAVRKLPDGETLKLLFYAHGGLVPESGGLAIARKHIDWWKANGVYPIYFAWETGFLQTVGQLLRGAQPRGLADLKDSALEKLARLLQGEKIWSGMKRNAEVASLPDNGAHLTARLLKRLCDRHPGRIELHAVGHSAGSIFHAHFLPAAFAQGVPRFKSAHFLAPAIRVDTFLDRLAPRIGNEVEHLTMYTMKTDFELADHCARIYGKSLLYLIRHALEPEEEAEILGLEESLRRDDDLKRLFGLAGHPAQAGEVVFSKSLASTGKRASQSTSHGGFDDDAPTMNSVALRVLGLSDNASLREQYPASRAAELSFEDIWGPPDLFAELGISPEVFAPAAAAAIPAAAPAFQPAPAPLPPVFAGGAGGGARRALCAGIDDYVDKPLGGCVADARLWETTLQALGFTTTRLLNQEATYEALRSELRRLVTSSRPGDVLVFQFSGHGTPAEDLDGDEESGPDEALCPVDCHLGRLLIDDDISDILAELPAGVSFTFFMDNCFSGDVSRFGFGRAPRATAPDARSRFLPFTPQLAQAHAAFRQARGMARRDLARGTLRPLRGVLFAACTENELAWEVGGQGEFTVRATGVLRQGIAGLTNQELLRRVREAFGPGSRQTPTIRCTDDLLAQGLLTPLDSGARGAAQAGAAGIAGELYRLAERLRNPHG